MFSIESYSVDYMGNNLLISSILKMFLTTINFSCEDLKLINIFFPLMSQFSHSVSMVTKALEKGEFLSMTVLVR